MNRQRQTDRACATVADALPHRGQRLITALLLTLTAPAMSAQQTEGPTYDAHYHASFKPTKGMVEAQIRITQPTARLLWLELSAPSTHYSNFSGDGVISRQDSKLHWQVPAQGGVLAFNVIVDNQRSGRYDARMTKDWAMVRLGDLFPPARAGSNDMASSRSSLSMDAPAQWRIETPYGAMNRTRHVSNPARRFDRPTGWAIAGELAVRRDRIADRMVTIASPLRQGVRRQDMLAFLRWTLPELVKVYPELPPRLLIVAAGDPMWRGGLSGPASFYLHAQRPLISEDSTSPPLHELIHVATSTPPADGDDWIAEGLAEYYSMELLRRSDGLSAKRFAAAIGNMRERSAAQGGKLSDPSSGINSTRAALLFHDLDAELRTAGSDLDQLVALLNDHGELSEQRLDDFATSLLGKRSSTLHEALMERR